MKKIIIIFIILAAFTINVSAENIEKEVNDGINETVSALSSDSKNTLEEMGVNNLEDAQKVSFTNIVKTLFNQVTDNINEPIKLFGMLSGIALLMSIYSLFGDKENEMISMSGILCGGTMATSVILEKLEYASVMLNEGCNFISSFVPVMSAVIATGGHPITASAYNLLVIFASQVSVYISTNVFTSFMGCYLAVCLVGGLNNGLSLSGLANGIKKSAIWIIGIVSTIFVALISLQGITGKAADSLALKTAKFAINSSIPIVGSAISDALVSIEGTIGVLRSTIGVFGILAGIAIILPGIVTVLLTKTAVELSAIIADMLGVKTLSELYKNIGSVITVLISVLVFYIMILVVCTTVVMLICGG